MARAAAQSKAGRPRAGDGEAKTARILQCAWALYVEGGYAAVTFDALVSRERMSKHTIYARFADKDALVRAMAEWRLDRWYHDNPLVGKSIYRDPVCAFIDICMRVTLTPDARAMMRILRGEETALAGLRELLMARQKWAVGRLAGIIESLPMHPATPPRIAAEAVCDMVLGHAMALYGDLPEDAALEAHLANTMPRMAAVANRLIGRPPETGLTPTG